MIAYLTGTICDVSAQSLTILVGGVGYQVYVPQSLVQKWKTDQTVSLYTHTNVTETALDLYGFESKEQLKIFKHLISVSGVGPKGALSILDLGSPGELLSAIANEQTRYISRASGIGEKTAKKIIVELQNKVLDVGTPLIATQMTQGDDEVIASLVVLGYQRAHIYEAVKQIPKELTDTSSKIKEALKVLGKSI